MIFDSEQILELFKSDNPHFRKIAENNIVDNFHIHSNLFFDCFFQNLYNVDLIRYACQRFPTLRGGFGKPMSFNYKKDYVYFAEYAAEHQLFIDKLNCYLNDIQSLEERRQFLDTLYNTFEGLRVDLEKIYPDCDYTVEYKDNSERQIMIFITGKCNLQCPYCFSNELKPVEMSLSDFEEILHWAYRNGVSRVSLCGGEPTSHSRFNEILSLLPKYAFKTYFASNFTIDCTSLLHFNSDVIDVIFIHLTDKIIENTHLRNCLHQNIRYAKMQGIKLIYRTNISNKTPKIDDWFQIIKETDLSTLNIALTFPTQHLSNQFVDTCLFDEYADVIGKIIDVSEKLKIVLSFAKPVPLCIFDKQTCHYLFMHKNFYPLCSIYNSHYTHNLCITPEKEFRPCLGLPATSLKFHSNSNWQEIENFCRQIVKPLLELPLFEKCAACFLYDRKLCQGACLSYKSAL